MRRDRLARTIRDQLVFTPSCRWAGDPVARRDDEYDGIEYAVLPVNLAFDQAFRPCWGYSVSSPKWRLNT
jgi:hypothetical protein